MKKIHFSYFNIKLKASKVKLSYFDRPGKKGTIVFIHGLGCSKEDFINAVKVKGLKDYEIFVFDWPGAGRSSYPSKKSLGINDLVEVIDYVVKKFSFKKFILVGHSLGGVVGLLYSVKHPRKVAGFINIEGSLVSRNARWSRKIRKMGFRIFKNGPFQELKSALKKSKNFGFRKYAKTLDSVLIKSYFDFSVSHAKICKNEYLLKKFLELKLPKIFIHGAENKNWVPVIKKLKKSGCSVAGISKSHHFSFIDNPSLFYKVLAKFADEVFANQKS
ncbi:MAG: alpha/beta hydrolase [Patescibacteria group bacterium]